MIKITALNQIENIDNNNEFINSLTKEAQEQVAFNEYNRALQLLVVNNKEEALIVLKELLNTELLDDIKKPRIRDGRSRPMLSLKYSCFKNIANIQTELKNYYSAIQNYWEATKLDNSDVMLWYKIGLISIEISNLEVACLAFKQGLNQNENHWPCLDNLITVLFAIPDYINCVFYVSIALERDPTYVKGMVFLQQIFQEIPQLQNYFKCYKNYCHTDLYLNITDNNDSYVLIKNADKLKRRWIKSFQIESANNSSNKLKLRRSLQQYSWIELGKSLRDMYNFITENNYSFLSHIVLTELDDLKNNSSDFASNDMNTEFGNIKISRGERSYFSDSEQNIIENDELSATENETKNHTLSKFQITDESLRSKNFVSNFCDNQDLDGSTLIGLNGIISKKILENDNQKLIATQSDKLNHDFGQQHLENGKMNIQFNLKDKIQKVKKRRRSSLCFLTQWAWSSNNTKRSSRSRNVGRKDHEKDSALEETLKQILPSSFMSENVRLLRDDSLKNEDSMDTMDMYYLIASKDNTAEDTKSIEDSKPSSPFNDDSSVYFKSEYEISDVWNFVKNHMENYNILTLIREFNECLCTKWNYEWPEELIDLFLQLYTLLSDHTDHSLLFVENNGLSMKLNADATLFFYEVYLDKWLSAKPCISPAISLTTLGIGLSSIYLGYIVFYSTQMELHNEKQLIFLYRLLWLKANIFLNQGEADISLRILELLLQYMHLFQSDSDKNIIKLKNCKKNSVISIKSVQNMLKFIQRGRQIREIQHLYQNKQYKELICILKDTFNIYQHTSSFLLYKEAPNNRDEHLRILLDSLWQLKQYEDCYVWSEACLNESWNCYLSCLNTSKNTEAQLKWTKTILFSLEKLDACVNEVSIFITQHLSESRRQRLVQNLINLVCHQLEVPNHTTVMIIESVLPWLLLHSILQYEEDKERVKIANTIKYKYSYLMQLESDQNEEIPRSITVLLKAHEVLGRHGWCCMNDGKLLKFILKLIVPQLRSPLYLAIRKKLKEPIEQIIYCLYGHPDKNVYSNKSKIKVYDEHVKFHTILTWDACELLFEFYRPDTLPNFESKRVDSISNDTVCLFKKICACVPLDSDPKKIIEEINAYLVGKKKRLPCVNKPLENQISYIYYLIADYYFKAGQPWKKAINYYKYDLSLHPNELNSWAGLAMSTSTLMETWLNNFQPNVNEEKYLREAKIAQRSYEHAINLAPSHLTIWTEFGNFLYTVHSFCSRLLKQESDSLNMERFRIIEARKEEMLDQAEKCFTSANRIYDACQGIDEPQDERWLYHYMLAKILEKRNNEPPVILKHYFKASQLLNDNNAEYPKRISHKCPQNLAIEALEVYYRIHAGILKFLERHEDESIRKSLARILMENLRSCLNSPFIMNDKSKISKRQGTYIDNEKINDNQSSNKKVHSTFMHNTNLEVVKRVSEQSYKIEGRKRSNESQFTYNVKRMKTNNISHLELMQDVVDLINDLITNVCSNVSKQQSEFDNLDDHDNRKKSFDNNLKIKINNTLVENSIDNKSDNLEINCIMKNLADSSIMNETLKSQCLMDTQNQDLNTDNYTNTKLYECFKGCLNPTRTISRRGSKESTYSSHTSTTCNNSSSTSSDDSSSSDETSSSSSTTNSDSESITSDADKKIRIVNKDSCITSEERAEIIEYCLAGLEQCVLRFPEHYKSIYRLAHFYCYNKIYKNINKCKQLLLGTYQCQFYPNQVIQGLFFERKNTNFFNGIWRIPSNEIDRPGSFASHMSRCILLLMQVLKETNDSERLIEICLQLRKTPDTDKKYLGDSDRKQLSCQALTLCLQCLRNMIKDEKPIALIETHTNYQKQILINVFHTYQSIKNIPEFETSELPKIRKLLEDAYLSYTSNYDMQGNIFERAKEYCRHVIRGYKTKVIENDRNINSKFVKINTNYTSLSNTEQADNQNLLVSNQQRKCQKSSIGGRQRGRSQNLTKLSQTRSNIPLKTQSRTEFKQQVSTDVYVPNLRDLSANPYLNPVFNQNMLAVMLGSSINTNMLGYLNPIGAYHNVLNQYQNKFNANSPMDIDHYKNNAGNQSSNKLPEILHITEQSLCSVKDRPDISITPVGVSKNLTKTKPIDSVSIHEAKSHVTSLSLQVSKPKPKLSKSKYSTRGGNISEVKESQVTQISKKPLQKNVLFSNCQSNINIVRSSARDQFIILPSKESESKSDHNVSLQHKLLCKKQNQLQECSQIFDMVNKQKQFQTVTTSYSNTIKANILSHGSQNVHDQSNNISYVYPSYLAKSSTISSYMEKPLKSQVAPATLSTQNSNNALSVITQLQQQSHLEIIPQLNIKSSSKLQKSDRIQQDSVAKTDVVPVYETSKPRVSSTINVEVKTKQDTSADNSVEIITLDD